MRILQLQLSAFGPFTDVSLDFDRTQAGLIVIHGSNEAGKSTTRHAIDHLLFGIPNSSFAFVHGYDQLQIGGLLQNDEGDQIAFVRRKGKKGSLREAKSQKVLDEDALSPFLGSLDRSRFLSLFGLDHERLVAGGREVLAGKGELGQLLFASGAGLVGLHELQNKLQEESKVIYAERARNPTLNAALGEVSRLRSEISKLQTESARWTEWDVTLRKTRDEVARLRQQVSEAEKRVRRTERLMESAPLWTRRKVWLASIQAAGHPRRLPDDFESRHREGVSKHEIATKQREVVNEHMTNLSQLLQTVPGDDSLLTSADLLESLRSKHASVMKASIDRLGLREQARLLTAEIEQLWHSLRGRGTEEVERQELTAPVQARLRSLIREHASRSESRARCEDDARKLREELAHLESRRAETGEVGDSGVLQDILDDLQRRGDLDKQILARERERSSTERQLESDFRSLNACVESWQVLASARLPVPGTVEDFEDRRRRWMQELDACDSKQRELDEERVSLQKSLEEGSSGALPTEESLAQARRLRSEGWRIIKRRYVLRDESVDPVSYLEKFPAAVDLSGAFEASLVEADQVVDQLRSHAEDVARRSENTARLNALERRSERLRDDRAHWTAESQRWHDDWRKLWDGFVAELGLPSEMKAWRSNAEEFQRTARRLSELEEELAEMVDQRDAVRTQAKSRLNQALPDIDRLTLTELSAAVRRIVVNLETRRQRWNDLSEQIAKRRTEAQLLSERLQQEIARMEEWKRDWHEALSRSKLALSSSIEEVSAILDGYHSIQLKTQQKEMLEERIAGMDRDEKEFEASLTDYVQSWASSLTDRPVVEVLPALIRMQQTQRDNATRRAEYSRQLDELSRRRAQVDLASGEAEAELASLCKEAECTTKEDLPKAIEESREARRIEEIRVRIEETDAQLWQLSAGENWEDFTRELDESPGDDWQATLDEDRRSLTAWNEEIDEAQRQIGSLETQLSTLDGNANAADRAEDLQAALAVVRRESRRYMMLRLAKDILTEAMEAYRKENEDPVLRRAGDFFRRLTLGSFEGLRIDFDLSSQTPILTGYRTPEGPSIFVESMSEGTVDQLFLALRLASLEGYLDHHESMPFVVDDILVNFDDDRSAAALDILADLSQRTQVLFFTHHRRLVEIAQNRLSESRVFVTELPSRDRQGQSAWAPAHAP